MTEEIFPTIKDAPLGRFIGHRLVDIKSSKEKPAKVYLHFDNGQQMFIVMSGGTLGFVDVDEA